MGEVVKMQAEQPEEPSGESLDSLLDAGLFFFGVDKIEAAVAVWTKAHFLYPDDSQAADYLESAGVDVQALNDEYPNGWPDEDETDEGEEAEQAPSERPLDNNVAVAPVPANDTNIGTASNEVLSGATSESPGKSKKNVVILLLGLLAAGSLLFASGIFSKESNETTSQQEAAKPSQPANAINDAQKPNAGLLQDASEDQPSAPLTPPATVPGFFSFSIEIEPSNALITLDDKVLEAKGGLSSRLPIDGEVHRLRVTAAGYEDRDIVFKDAPPPARVRLTRITSNPVAKKKTKTRRRVKSAPSKTASKPSTAVTEKISAPKSVEVKPIPKPPKPKSSRKLKTDNDNPWGN